jgi:RNA polymerase I-specific transcription initiation factor RRN6
VDEAASSMKALIDFLSQEKDNNPSMAVSLLPLISSSVMADEAGINSDENPLHLSAVYDRMIESWVSCLPLQTPGQMRLAKERMVRAIAAELCLASKAIAVRDKSVHFPESTRPSEGFDLTLPVRPRSNFSLQESGTRQVPNSQDARKIDEASYPTTPGLPTPTSTPHHTLGESAPSETPAEDPAISRLRSYTLSIKSQPPLGAAASSILDHWPTTPGLDPTNYSWEAARKAVAEVWDQDSDEEETTNRRKEEERRRHRTERFLKRQRANTDDAASQPAPTVSFGSQPDPAANVTSSQPAENALPMTQPDRGLFGSRMGQKSWKKRRTKGF